MPKISKPLKEEDRIRKLFSRRLSKGHTFSILAGDDDKDLGFKAGTYVFAEVTHVPDGLKIVPKGTSTPPRK